MALRGKSSELSLKLLLPVFFIAFVLSGPFAKAGPDATELARQKIESLKADLSLMMVQAMHGLADEDIETQKATFESKVQELDVLRGRYQALAPIKQTEATESQPQISSARNHLFVTKDSPKTYEDVDRFVAMDPAHASVAMRDFMKVRELDSANRWKNELPQIGTDLTRALAIGIKKGNFSSMTALLSYLQFLGPHASWFQNVFGGDLIFLLNSDKPVLVEFNDLSDKAVISWLKTKPAKQDVLDFFSANNSHPLHWIGGAFRGYQASDGSEIFRTLLETGWDENLKDMLLLLDVLNTGAKLDAQWISKNVSEAKSFSDLQKLFESTSFEGKILILESAFAGGKITSASDVNLALYELNSDLRYIARSNSKNYETQLSWLRWLTVSNMKQFLKLQPSEEQIQAYKKYGKLSFSYRITKTFISPSRPKTLIPLQEAMGLQCRFVHRSN